MNRRGCLWFAGGLLLAGIAGVLAFMTLMRAANVRQTQAPTPKVKVLVATHDMTLHTVVASGDVALREVSPEVVPQGALTDPEQAVGQMVVDDISADEIILARRLLKPDYVGPKVALVMDPAKVVIAFPAGDLLTTLNILRPGDRVDMEFTLAGSVVSAEDVGGQGGKLATVTVMSDVEVAAVVRGGDGNEGAAPRALLLAFDPQDALMLKYLRDSGTLADMALRSPAAAEGPFDTVPVDGDYVMQRLQLRGVFQ